MLYDGREITIRDQNEISSFVTKIESCEKIAVCFVKVLNRLRKAFKKSLYFRLPWTVKIELSKQ